MLWVVIGVVTFLVGLIHFILPKNYNSFAFERTISKIPGPPTIPFFGSRFILTVDNEGFMSFMLNYVNKYRPLLRVNALGNYSIIASEVDDAEIIMNNRSHIDKSLDYELLHPWLGTGLLTSTGDKWFSHRRMLTPAFHFGILEQYLDVFTKNAQVLTEKLRSHGGRPLGINPEVSLCTLDIVCETAMGTVVNAQHGGEKDYVRAVLEMSNLFQIRQLSPWMYRDCLFNITPTGKRQKEVLRILHEFTDKVISEKRALFKKKQAKKQQMESENDEDFGVRKKRSFLDLLVEISELEGKLNQEEIREEVDTFMFEGHDTTATALSWALFELGLNPEIQEEAHREQDRIFGGSDREPTTADVAQMKYLERVVKETLRLYPSVPLLGRKLSQNVTLSGYEVPAGAGVAVFIYYIHRDPKLYPNPDSFEPDRFLPERIAKRHPYSYIPFSAGPRNCIGQKFALMEEVVVLSQILRNFTVKSITARSDVQPMAELILRPKDNLILTFSPRTAQL